MVEWKNSREQSRQLQWLQLNHRHSQVEQVWCKVKESLLERQLMSPFANMDENGDKLPEYLQLQNQNLVAKWIIQKSVMQ